MNAPTAGISSKGDHQDAMMSIGIVNSVEGEGLYGSEEEQNQQDEENNNNNNDNNNNSNDNNNNSNDNNNNSNGSGQFNYSRTSSYESLHEID
jgi:hypothetical protein